MLIFASIGLAGVLLLIGGMIFGHDHDGDVEHEMDHDSDHGGGDGDHGFATNEPAISVFSTKVVGAFITAFGAAGFIARYQDVSYLFSSFIGACGGLFLGAIVYFGLKLMYGQQASSIVPTATAIGLKGVVTTTIGVNSFGEVGLTLGGKYTALSARANNGQEIPQGTSVRVVSTMGSNLVVEKTA